MDDKHWTTHEMIGQVLKDMSENRFARITACIKTLGNLWNEIYAELDSFDERRIGAMFGGVKFLTFTMAGRVMITFQKDERSVTILAADDPEYRGGLHGIDCSVDEAVEMIEAVINNYERGGLKPDDKIGMKTMIQVGGETLEGPVV